VLIGCDENTVDHLDAVDDALATIEQQDRFTRVLFGACAGRVHETWDTDTLCIEACPDNYLAGLYQHCSAFVYPAPKDATGLRVVEALRAGALVITHKNRAINEYAGQAPFYCDSASSKEMLDALHRTLHGKKSDRKRRIEQGHKAVKDLDWGKSAWKLLSALKR